MFKRKLEALDYINADIFNVNDHKLWRSLIIWLEDQKIRHYKIEDRAGLRNFESPQWQKHFDKYLKDVACPVTSGKLNEQMEWLIGYAIRLEYSDNKSKFVNVTSENIQKNKAAAPKIVSTNPLDNLDFDSNDFKNGVRTLAQMVKVPAHPDHLVTLQALSRVICDRLNQDAIKNPDLVIPKGKPFPFENTDLGYKTNDKTLAEAGKILRLLYIQDLRLLQTKINECIVSVQKVTANPKTDTKLGKVGY